MVLEIQSLMEVSAGFALITLGVLFLTISIQIAPFFKKLISVLSETEETMKVYRELGEESVTAVVQSQEILEAGKEISNDVIETKRAITSTGNAICSHVLDFVMDCMNK